MVENLARPYAKHTMPRCTNARTLTTEEQSAQLEIERGFANHWRIMTSSAY